ncbi:MAG TPA: SDR family NAD(P)-dependent oxidoreductase [Burkholderiales bacterium]|nr:SDR family NAD(P)-dependent oxidoreductase [Burkholderiales bacterium]
MPPSTDLAAPYGNLERARVVITGGRGTLGGAVARAFAELGAEVWSLDVSPVPKEANKVRQRVASVRDRASLEKVRDEMGGAATVLVNSAGIQRRTDFAACDEETWAELMDVNMNGVYRSCQVFGAGMRESGGSIVNFGSVNGVVVSGKGTPYGIAKAAVSFMTKVMAVEWAPKVRVNAIAPTAIPSGMTKDLFSRPEYVAAKLAEIPLGRYGTEADIVNAVLFLASDASALITGQTLVMDGGLSLR